MKEKGKSISPPWIDEVKINVKNSKPKFHPTNLPTIFRAPTNISKTDPAAYEPSVVSIGPLHGGFDELQNCKWSFLRCVLSKSGNGKDASSILDKFLKALEALDEEVRACYSENLGSIDPGKLATTMLLDGCCIIYLMLWRLEEGEGKSIREIVNKMQEIGAEEERCGKERSVLSETESGSGSGSDSLMDLEIGVLTESGSGSESDSLVDLEIGEADSWELFRRNSWTCALMVRDLLKPGNQIPFFVITLIFDILFKTTSSYPENFDHLTNLALNLFSRIHPNKSIFRTRLPRKIHHMLHLFHCSIVTDCQVPRPAARAAKQSTTLEPIPNATDLAMAGVKFKRKEKFNSFLDITFKNGILEIPPLGIYNHTKSLFRNLIAFEQCYVDFHGRVTTDFDECITTYANFMDRIIDTTNDVRLLCMEGILIKRVGTDDELASLFNQLRKQITVPKQNYLNDLFNQVNEYHRSRWHQWRAWLVRNYFSNPWVIISVLAAVLLLLLTIEKSFFHGIFLLSASIAFDACSKFVKTSIKDA